MYNPIGHIKQTFLDIKPLTAYDSDYVNKRNRSVYCTIFLPFKAYYDNVAKLKGGDQSLRYMDNSHTREESKWANNSLESHTLK